MHRGHHPFDHDRLPLGMRLSTRYRRAVYAIFALLWASGAAWLVLHYFLMRHGEFGLEPHPLESWSLRVHGAAGFAALWLAGLLWVVHVRIGLARPKRRVSGIVLIALFALLALSGYLLYYASDDGLRDVVRWVHWIIGLALIVPFLLHSLRARSARSKSGEATSSQLRAHRR